MVQFEMEVVSVSAVGEVQKLPLMQPIPPHSIASSTLWLFHDVAVLLHGIHSPYQLESRQSSCSTIHVFGARVTTALASHGSAGNAVNPILNAHPGATLRAINYLAARGDSYGSSVSVGAEVVPRQVTSFANRCPSTQIACRLFAGS
jgi:hypothetical protein